MPVKLLYVIRGVILATALVPLAVTLSACPPKSVTTPQGKTAYTADQVAKVVGALQDTVIQANSATPPAIPDSTAIPFVQATRAILLTLKATPAGWQATVATAWHAAEQRVPSADLQKFQSYFTAVDVAVASLTRG